MYMSQLQAAEGAGEMYMYLSEPLRLFTTYCIHVDVHVSFSN